MILALRALGLGDLLAAVPALRALRRLATARGHQLVVATPASLAGLARLAAGVDAVVDVDAVHGFDGVRAALPRASVAVNLHGRGPESTALLRASGAARVVAYGCDATWHDDEHELDRWCRLLVESGLVDDADPLDLRVDVEPDGRFAGAVVVHPGASSPSRRWPAERWRAVTAALAADGHRIVVTGSPAERPLAESVGAGVGEVVAGSTDVVGLLRLAAAADLVLCGDTGMAHVASAVGTRSVVLFGPVSPGRWGPPPTGPHVALWHGRSGDPHATAPDDGLLAITVDEVLAAAAPTRRDPARVARIEPPEPDRQAPPLDRRVTPR